MGVNTHAISEWCIIQIEGNLLKLVEPSISIEIERGKGGQSHCQETERETFEEHEVEHYSHRVSTERI